MNRYTGYKSYVGKKSGELTVVKDIDSKKCLCQCSCGNVKITNRRDIVRGHTVRCDNKSKHTSLLKTILCRWVTQKDNNRNKTNHKYYTYNNITLPMFRWLELLKIPFSAFKFWVDKKHMSIQNILDYSIKYDNKIRYLNGNTFVVLDLTNGTRYMETVNDDEKFNLNFPVSIDLNISNYCEKGCSFCYQNCTKQGKNADLDKIKLLLHPFMEVAININVGYKIDMQFIDFLEYCRDNHIIVNATINQTDLMNRPKEIRMLQDYELLHGIGVSYDKHIAYNNANLNNIVIHVIDGLVNNVELNELTAQGYNILILGYKQKGRAKDNDLPDMSELKDWLKDNLQKTKSIISFDNKAIEQLGIRKLVNDKMWNMCYQGDEGTISMYINGVDMTFAQNSFTDIYYNINNYNIQEMFDIVRKEQ